MKIEIDRLERLYEVNAKADPGLFSLHYFERRHPCATTRCFVGNYIVATPNCKMRISPSGDGILGQRPTAYFGITHDQFEYLFFPDRDARKPDFSHSFENRLARIRDFIDKHKPTIPTMDFHEPHALADARFVLDSI